MGNSETKEVAYVSHSVVKRECQRRIEGYGSSEEEAIADLNRKCIKKGYDQITIGENSDEYNCGEITLFGQTYYNTVWFKNRKNVTVAYVFLNY